ncbi:MAG TPA: phage tail protein [Longimicrobium sp.]|nr:phage tail protein [Longimicrobium sp.]
MDANGQRFWLVADAPDWEAFDGVQWDAARRSLRLASRRVPPRWASRRTEALARLNEVRQAHDLFGTRARWNGTRVVAAGALPPEIDASEVPVARTPGDQAPTDLALGYDGVLYVAGPFGVSLLDRRRHRKPVTVAAEGFTAWRIAADPAGGVWVLDGGMRRLGRIRGAPWPNTPYGAYGPGVFRPVDENPDPPRLVVHPEAVCPPTERPVAIDVSPGGRLALLTWVQKPAGAALLRIRDTDGNWSAPVRLNGAPYPYSLAWVSEQRVAVMVPAAPEAPVYPVDARGSKTLPVGDLYPLRGASGSPFAHTLSFPARYPAADGGHLPLHRLSLPSFTPVGTAMNARLLDGGSTQAVWHRIYLEACIPAGTGVVIHLAATDEPAAPMLGSGEWYPHRFGAAAPDDDAGVPLGAWVAHASELPFHPGLLQAEPQPERAGLWTALVQRAGRRVRSLRGRYLWVRAELAGSGAASPEVAAVRVYGSRFSYAEQYLPEVYRETEFGPDAERRAPATPADFLERFLGNFEGVLTTLEDRVAAAWVLTDPDAAPGEALEWLAGWLGLSLDPALPEERRRAMLRAWPEIAKRRGTLRGLALALDAATGGGVQGGEVVVLEDFRLRRTFSTILGADLADESDPLTGALAVSGNSYVGDTLFLGDDGTREDEEDERKRKLPGKIGKLGLQREMGKLELLRAERKREFPGDAEKREFLALFSADLKVDKEEADAIRRLYDRLAHRITILVHQQVQPQDLGLIARVVERETPAHVEARVLAATHPFVVGMASLVGVDTYLTPRPPQTPVRVDQSRIGARDFIQTPVSLDPRLEGGTGTVLQG